LTFSIGDRDRDRESIVLFDGIEENFRLTRIRFDLSCRAFGKSTFGFSFDLLSSDVDRDILFLKEL